MSKLATGEGLENGRRVQRPLRAGTCDHVGGHILASGSEPLSIPFIASPHLGNPEQAKDFEKRISEAVQVGMEQQSTFLP